MADYIERAKQVVANLKSKDQTVPPNAYLLTIADAFVRAEDGQWFDLLDKLGLVIDPTDPGNLFAVGTPGPFTPLSATELNSLKAFHFLRVTRRIIAGVVEGQSRLHDAVVAGDVGDTPSAAVTRIAAAAAAEALANLGDPDPANDPEV